MTRTRAAQVRAIAKADPPIVVVVAAPIGPPCAVLTDEGVVIHGYRVADDWHTRGSEVGHRGWCVEAVFLDGKYGHPLTTPTGRELIVNAEDAKIRGALSRAETVRLRIRAAEPPPLPPKREPDPPMQSERYEIERWKRPPAPCGCEGVVHDFNCPTRKNR